MGSKSGALNARGWNQRGGQPRPDALPWGKQDPGAGRVFAHSLSTHTLLVAWCVLSSSWHHRAGEGVRESHGSLPRKGTWAHTLRGLHLDRAPWRGGACVQSPRRGSCARPARDRGYTHDASNIVSYTMTGDHCRKHRYGASQRIFKNLSTILLGQKNNPFRIIHIGMCPPMHFSPVPLHSVYS